MAIREILLNAASALAEHLGVAEAFVRRFGPIEPTGLELPPSLRPNTPDDLGDLLETLRDDARAAAFDALLAGRLRHASGESVATTQRFTPPWIAEWLVGQALDLALAPGPAIDPACGGGRLLLALFRAMRRRDQPADAILRHRLVGTDVDPLAVEVASRALWLEAAREPGADPDALPHPAIVPTPAPLGSLAPFDALERATRGRFAANAFAHVVTNPPYMGNRHLAPEVRRGLAAFGAFKGDLYTAFLRRCVELTEPGGALAVLCQESFLFVHRDRALRTQLLQQVQLHRVLHLGAGAFEAFDGEKASVVALAARRQDDPELAPVEVIDLHDLRTPAAKQHAFARLAEGGGPSWRRVHSRFGVERARHGDSWTYWWPDALAPLLTLPGRLGDAFETTGNAHKTADNDRFLRWFWEVPPDAIGELADPDARWVPYAKGGPHRKWAGNLGRVVDWSSSALEHYRTWPTANLLPERYWFREGLTWSDFGGRAFSLRHLPPGCVFDMAGPSMFLHPTPHALPLTFWLAFLNAPLVCHLLNLANPTIHYQVRDLRELPIPDLHPDDPRVHRLDAIGQQALALTLHLDSFDPTTPSFQAPVLATLQDPDLPPDAATAEADRTLRATLAAIATLEREAASLVESLYGASRTDVAPLDRRLVIPQTRLPRTDLHLIDAIAWTVGVAEGRFPHPTRPDQTPPPGQTRPADIHEIALELWGQPRWQRCLDARAQTLERFLSVSYQPWLRARFLGRAWHPARVLRGNGL